MKIHYETEYTYPQQVMSSVTNVWLRPMSDERQSCAQFSLETDPPSRPRPYSDYFGNTVYHFDITAPHDRVALTVDTEVHLVMPCGTAASLPDGFELTAAERDRWLDFLVPTPLTATGQRLSQLAATMAEAPYSAAELLRGLGGDVQRSLHLLTTPTSMNRSADEAFGAGSGTCVDFVHVFLALCRLRGYPARFVSGYLCAETTAWHTWAEVCAGNDVWLAYDPTYGCLPDGRYVEIATGRDYDDVPPVRGAHTSLSGHGLEVGVSALELQQQ